MVKIYIISTSIIRFLKELSLNINAIIRHLTPTTLKADGPMNETPMRFIYINKNHTLREILILISSKLRKMAAKNIKYKQQNSS